MDTARKFTPSLLLLAALFAAIVATVFWWSRRSLPWEDSHQTSAGEQPNQTASLEAREQQADKTFWAKEMLAQNCGRTFEDLWDSVNASSNKLAAIAALTFDELLLPEWAPARQLPHSIELRQATTSGATVSTESWRQKLELLQRDGWKLKDNELRQNQFDTDDQGRPARSHFYFSAHLVQPTPLERAML